MRRGDVRTWVLLAAAAVLLVPGCASRNLTKDRMRVVEAEAIDARQRASAAEAEARDNQLRADQALAQVQETRAQVQQKDRQVLALTEEATAGRQAQMALARQTQKAREQAAQLDRLYGEVADLTNLVDGLRKEYAEQNQNKAPSGRIVAPENVEAFRRDLAGRLRDRGINLPVEVRTLRSGEQQVAVVLRGAFPSGKHSLAHNMEAVKAVVWLGELISREYPGSRIRVEGHTDSSPLVKTKAKYGDNYGLSLQRAGSVEELLTKAGVAPSSIETVGMGPDRPLEDNKTKRGKEMNRRVEIYIQPAV